MTKQKGLRWCGLGVLVNTRYKTFSITENPEPEIVADKAVRVRAWSKGRHQRNCRPRLTCCWSRTHTHTHTHTYTLISHINYTFSKTYPTVSTKLQGLFFFSCPVYCFLFFPRFLRQFIHLVVSARLETITVIVAKYIVAEIIFTILSKYQSRSWNTGHVIIPPPLPLFQGAG